MTAASGAEPRVRVSEPLHPPASCSSRRRSQGPLPSPWLSRLHCPPCRRLSTSPGQPQCLMAHTLILHQALQRLRYGNTRLAEGGNRVKQPQQFLPRLAMWHISVAAPWDSRTPWGGSGSCPQLCHCGSCLCTPWRAAAPARGPQLPPVRARWSSELLALNHPTRTAVGIWGVNQ